jgi:putative hemolysin
MADRIAHGVLTEWSETLGFGIVISITTYASLLWDELVPKQSRSDCALERTAVIMAGLRELLARITADCVDLRQIERAIIFRALRLPRHTRRAHR